MWQTARTSHRKQQVRECVPHTSPGMCVDDFAREVKLSVLDNVWHRQCEGRLCWTNSHTIQSGLGIGQTPGVSDPRVK